MFAGDDETTHHGLTDYELERVAHIRRNREIMKQLGLGDHDIVRAARERCGDVGDASSTKKKTKHLSVAFTEPLTEQPKLLLIDY